MDTTQVKFEVIDTNLKKSNKTYGYVNPNVDNIQLKNLVTGAYALSKNSVGNIFRIDTTNITGGGGEVTPDTPVLNGKSVSFASTSDFFSTDATTFHTFLQSAYNAYSNPNSNDVALSFEIADGTFDEEDPVAIAPSITYGDLDSLLQNNSATIQDFVSLINDKIEEEGGIGVAASYDETNGLTFTNTNGTAESDTVSVTVTEGNYGVEGAGHLILESIYNGASDKTAFSAEENYDDGDPYTAYTLSLATE